MTIESNDNVGKLLLSLSLFYLPQSTTLSFLKETSSTKETNLAF